MQQVNDKNAHTVVTYLTNLLICSVGPRVHFVQV